MREDRLPGLAGLAAAVEAGDPERLRAAARAVLELPGGPEAAREVLRQCSLFLGFPRVVRALGVLDGLLPAAIGAEPEPPVPASGEAFFRRLYGEDAGRVGGRLRELDPLLAEWILGHAYGTVLARPGLTLAERERLAVLALAATACWEQWTSHVRNARRLGIPPATLAADLELVPDWPREELRQEARRRLPARAAAPRRP